MGNPSKSHKDPTMPATQVAASDTPAARAAPPPALEARTAEGAAAAAPEQQLGGCSGWMTASAAVSQTDVDGGPHGNETRPTALFCLERNGGSSGDGGDDGAKRALLKRTSIPRLYSPIHSSWIDTVLYYGYTCLSHIISSTAAIDLDQGRGKNTSFCRQFLHLPFNVQSPISQKTVAIEYPLTTNMLTDGGGAVAAAENGAAAAAPMQPLDAGAAVTTVHPHLRMSHDERRGHHLVARRRIPAGATLLVEAPLAACAAAPGGGLPSFCPRAQCLAALSSVAAAKRAACGGCQALVYCSASCRDRDAAQHTGCGECALLRSPSAASELGSWLRDACLALRLLWRGPLAPPLGAPPIDALDGGFALCARAAAEHAAAALRVTAAAAAASAAACSDSIIKS